MVIFTNISEYCIIVLMHYCVHPFNVEGSRGGFTTFICWAACSTEFYLNLNLYIVINVLIIMRIIKLNLKRNDSLKLSNKCIGVKTTIINSEINFFLKS